MESRPQRGGQGGSLALEGLKVLSEINWAVSTRVVQGPEALGPGGSLPESQHRRVLGVEETAEEAGELAEARLCRDSCEDVIKQPYIPASLS